MKTFELNSSDVLLVGQAVMGRTETLERYLKNRTNCLGVLGITQAFSQNNLSKCVLYEKGKQIRKFTIPTILLGKSASYKQFLLSPVYVLYLLSILFCTLKLKRRFQLFIGIGCFPCLIGVILKKLSVVKHIIYYSIDFFPPIGLGMDKFLRKVFVIVDKILVKKSDINWVISPRIIEGRRKFANLYNENCKNIIVPLGFDSSLLRNTTFEKIDRNMVVFVGSTGHYHGLQLLLDSLPHILQKLPETKIKIIGPGPWDSLKNYVVKNKLRNHFVFRGFIENSDELCDEISKCAIGLALYVFSKDNPAFYADPGKPKLYCFCGIPVVITKTPLVAEEINERRAGIAINYDRDELAQAVISLLRNPQTLKEYRRNAVTFARDYAAEQLFDRAFEKTFNIGSMQS